MSDYFSGPVKDGDSSNLILTKIWYWMFRVASALGVGGSGVAGPVGTYHFSHVANSGSTTIPTTAKRWSVAFIGSGTGNTFGTNTSVTGGQTFSDNASPASAISIVCDGSTVADIFYSTT